MTNSKKRSEQECKNMRSRVRNVKLTSQLTAKIYGDFVTINFNETDSSVVHVYPICSDKMAVRLFEDDSSYLTTYGQKAVRFEYEPTSKFGGIEFVKRSFVAEYQAIPPRGLE